jgi:hypothetical protein
VVIIASAIEVAIFLGAPNECRFAHKLISFGQAEFFAVANVCWAGFGRCHRGGGAYPSRIGPQIPFRVLSGLYRGEWSGDTSCERLFPGLPRCAIVLPQVPPSALACLIIQNSPNGIKRKKLAPKVPTYQSPIILDETRWKELAVTPHVARGGITREI